MSEGTLYLTGSFEFKEVSWSKFPPTCVFFPALCLAITIYTSLTAMIPTFSKSDTCPSLKICLTSKSALTKSKIPNQTKFYARYGPINPRSLVCPISPKRRSLTTPTSTTCWHLMYSMLKAGRNLTTALHTSKSRV